MRLKATAPVSTASGVHMPGDIFEASGGEAGRLLFLGFAVKAASPKKKASGKKD